MRINRVESRPWSLALSEPFSIASGVQARADNVLVSVTLDDGTVGLGEAAPFPAVNGETQAQALAALRDAQSLVGEDPRRLGQLTNAVTGSMSARCGLEMALLDAVLRRARLPMWSYFGGASTRLTIDHTITTGADPGAAAARIAAAGYHTIKLKVGAGDDRKRLEAVVAAAPHCQLILDGNEGLHTADEVLALTTANTVLFEQPLPKTAFEETRRLFDRTRVPIAADEAVTTLADVRFLAEQKLAHVVNLKTTKSGLFASFEMAVVARALGLGLMIGAMVESPLALSASACLAAGVGGFSFFDLDTHLFFHELPTMGGFVQTGPHFDLSAIDAGHGVTLLQA